MEFDKEIDFEDALVDLLVTKYGWKSGVLNHPTEAELLANWAKILYQNNRSVDRLGEYPLTAGEMRQLVEQIKALKTPIRLNGFVNGKTVAIKRNHPADTAHFGKEVSLDIFSRTEIAAGKSIYQIARQPDLPTPHPLASDRRGDLMLLINGMPLIHIELKRSGVPVVQAANQIEKYTREGALGGFFSLIQVFVAMTPEETLYFANPGSDGAFNRDYYFHWADANNERVNAWDQVAEKLLSIPMAHQLVGYYTVADGSDGILKVMRSYQFYAAHAIFTKVLKNEEWEGGQARLGGYVWHTTGSGKTMTCFKTAQLIAEMHAADKVVFLLDRIELGTQTLQAFRGFSGDVIEVQATENTSVLVSKLQNDADGDRLIVTSIQKMSRIKDEVGGTFAAALEKMKAKRIVIIVDEAHQDVNGEMLLTIKDTFKAAMFFGFTGTPKLKEGGKGDPTTATVFGGELHRYTIADGLRDKNVLAFDPVRVCTYRDIDVRRAVALAEVKAETEQEALDDPAKKDAYLKWMNPAEKSMVQIEGKLPGAQYDRDEHRQAVVKDIQDHWLLLSVGNKFHAILATASIPEAIEYYRIFKTKVPQMAVTALFDPTIDNMGGGIFKEEALLEILEDYNARYNQHFTIPTWGQFKKDVSNRLAHKEPYKGISRTPEKQLNILIVVDQMLTGFDSKWLNTLYLDKMREEENLIQAFSRTNRLFGPEKPFGSIRYYRKPHTMTKNIEDALKLYSGDRPFALYVDRLETNLNGLNQTFSEIKALFNEAGIDDFAQLPADAAEKGRFAALFKQFNDYLNAAKIQGFTFGEMTYTFEHEGEGDTLFTMSFDERVYGILALRYKELASGGGGNEPGDPSLPFDIDPYLTEISIGMINADYMDSRFQKYLRSFAQRNVSPAELATLKAELHKTFAGLPWEDQKYAEMLIDDIENGRITLEPRLTLQDYIVQYKTKALNRDIDLAVDTFGLDKDILVSILRSGRVTDANLNEFGRFDKLIASVDPIKAKENLEDALGMVLSPFSFNTRLRAVLKEFLKSGGKGEKIPKRQQVLPGVQPVAVEGAYLEAAHENDCGGEGVEEDPLMTD